MFGKVLVTVSSFMFGALSTWTVLWGAPSTVQSQSQPQPPPSGFVLKVAPGAKIHSVIGFSPDKEPIIPGLGARIPPLTITAEPENPAPQILDGLDCDGCVFNNALLKYSGGAVRLEHASFTGTTTLELHGAAQNTIAVLNLMGYIAKGGRIFLPSHKPPIRKATAKAIVKGNFQSPHFTSEPGLSRQPNQP
jgi:hypothetical protein